ncbi:MAG: FecR family protein [Thermodesulfovibrionales bacterium]
MLRQLKTISLFLLIFLIFLPSFAFAQHAIGKLTFVQGRVDVLIPPATRAVPVKFGDAVFVGDIVRAKSNSKAEITFSDANIVRVASNTRVEISEYIFEESKGKGVLKLSRGKVHAIIQQKIAKKIATFGEANRFEIHTPTAIAGVRGTNFVVSFMRNSTSVLVFEGFVNTFNPKFPDLAVTVTSGYITTIPLDQPPQPARPATDAEKNMYKGDFTQGDSGGKSDAEDTVISEATSGDQMEPGAGETGTETPSPTGALTETPSTPTDIPQPPPISETIGTDTTPPVITIKGPQDPTNLRDAIFNVLADETVTFTYIIDNTIVVVSPNTSSDNFVIPDLKDGNHIVTIIATDQTGNKTTINYSWTVDGAGPIVTITPTSASPEAGSDLTTLNINLTSNEPATYSYTYTLDGKEKPGTRPLISIPNVSEGIHTLKIDVQAKDALGNPNSTSKSFDLDLNRYTLTGSISGTGNTLTGSATGDVAGVLNKDWGGWSISMSGSREGSSGSSWQMVSGGEGYDSDGYSSGYWIDKANGRYSGTTMTGTSQLTYLTTDTLGTGIGTVNGTYGEDTWQATDIGTGTYTETPLNFGGSINGDFMYWEGMSGDGWMEGLMGGTESLWSGSSSLLSLGTYENQNGNTLWGMDIGTEGSPGWTSDEGAFLGTIGGIALNDTLEGLAIGIYIKPNDDGYETGYIYSNDISGSLYPEIGMYELGGNLTAVTMGTTSIIEFSEEEYYGTIVGDITGSIGIESMNLIDQNWGVWRGGGGTYDSITSENWTAYAEGESYGLVYIEEENPPIPSSWTATVEGELYDLDRNIAGIWGSQITGSRIDTDNKLVGTSVGYLADISSNPFTAITSGEIIGIFNPNDYTWQAISAGVWIETSKFLEMATNEAGRVKLQQLNIPCVEVGRADLVGSNNFKTGNINVNLNNVIFFAPNTNARPGIWATNSVSGNYSGNPSGVSVPLSGNGLNANFNVHQWDTTNSKWLSTVRNGQGSITRGGPNVQNLRFKGVSAGTINQEMGTFSGTGAGIAR